MRIQATRGFNDSASELNAKVSKADQIDEAVRCFDHGQSETALKKFDAILRETPDHVGAQIGRSFAVLELASRSDPSLRDEAIKGALDSFQEITSNHPECWQAHVGEGEALALLNQPREALESARIAIDLAPKNHTAQSSYADRLVAKAHSEFDRLTRAGDHPTALKARHQHLEEALKHYDFALDNQPHHPATLMKKTAALTARGFTRMDMRDYQGAKGDFEHVLALSPDHTEAEHGKNLVLAVLGEPRQSVFCNGALP